MLVNVVENDGNIKNSNKCRKYNTAVLIFSLLSVVFDILIGSALVLQYYKNGKSNFAISTFSFIFIPLVIIQVFSIKLYFFNNDMKAVQWILHLILLGFISRFISTIKKYVNNFNSVTYSASNSVDEDVNNMKILYLFKCFMESVPQLILQLFITSTSNDLFFTRLSIFSSILSLIWALIIHTKFKKGSSCGLVCLILWRTGMISARVSALVLCAHVCGPWIILFMGSHWLAMILWITYQKSKANERKNKGEFHSAVFGLIYCFCFLSLKLGQSKWQAITLNLLFFFENLIFLTIFLSLFSVEHPNLAVVSFVVVIFGSLLGISSLLLYYLFFNTIRTEKCTSPNEDILPSEKNEVVNEECSQEEQRQDVLSSSNSIIIIEENPALDTNNDEKFEISQANIENIYEEPNQAETGKDAAHSNLSAAVKRRAICSSVDLQRFAESKTVDPEMDVGIVIVDETPSEILSTRDYENICAVNIAREPWGIRSWRAYSDIETLRHDDSVVNEGRLDNLTTSSEYSAKFEDKDSFISEDKCDIDTISEKVSVSFLSPLSSNMLEAIVEEELTEPNPVTENDKETKCNGKSSLVATIDKICLYTPLRTRSRSTPNHSESPVTGGLFGKNIKDCEKTEKFLSSRKLCLAAEKKDVFSPFKDKFRPIQKLNIFKERYETNRYHIPNKSEMLQEKKKSMDKENFAAENYQKMIKVGHDNGTTSKTLNFRENGLFLKEIFTPKSEKCNFRMAYMKSDGYLKLLLQNKMQLSQAKWSRK